MEYAIISLASRLQGLASDFILSEFARRGITDLAPCHGDILASLFKGAEGCSLSELAQLTNRTKSTVSVLVDKLVENGYVVKDAGKTDGRTVKITLSDKGRALRHVFEEISREMNTKLLKGFKPYEAEALEDMLRRCSANFE